MNKDLKQYSVTDLLSIKKYVDIQSKHLRESIYSGVDISVKRVDGLHPVSWIADIERRISKYENLSKRIETLLEDLITIL